MLSFPIRWRPLAMIAIAASLTCAFTVSTYAQKKPKITKVKSQPPKKDEPSVEPDKVLYDRAMKDMKLRRYIEARLDLQTLINTYPDSEFLAKAKLAVADSFYKEGGTSNFTQAVDEYKNFIVFFPFLEESAYAQMQVAMAHYRMMEKSDRDNSQAQGAESEFQVFLKKYPDSPLRPQAEQYLRNVQEVLADGEFRTGRFYYVRARTNPADYSSAAARLIEVSQRYPLYSQTDEALWMLGDVYERVKRFSKNEDDKNHWSDLASQCYRRIVTDYPLSKLAPDAKARLQGMGAAVPPADPAALARMEKDRDYEREHHRNAVLATPLTAFEARPSVSAAARGGDPNFNPPDDAVSATTVLKQGAAGPSFGIAAQQPASDSSDNAGAPNIIEGSSVPADSSATDVTTGVAAQIIEAPSGPPPDSSSSSPSSSSSSSPAEATAAISNIDNSGSGAPAAAPAIVTSSASTDQAPGTSPVVAPQGTTPATQPVAAAVTGSSSPQAAQGKAAPATAPAADSSKESTSKKKKGLHKLNPF